MSRPKPKVLMATSPNDKHKFDQITEASEVFAVFYDNVPINIRTMSLIEDVIPRYKNTTFISKGSALLLANKLNEEFKTNKFKVFKMIPGEEISDE